MPNENEPNTPPDGGGGDSAGDDDAWADEFAREFEAIREKVARIPDDIGEKLDQIMRQGASSGTGTTSPQPRRTSGQGGAPPRQPEPQQPQTPPVPQPEKRPKATHWYFRERPGRG